MRLDIDAEVGTGLVGGLVGRCDLLAIGLWWKLVVLFSQWCRI